VIRQEIGDAARLCASLFNMGHLHLQNDEPEEAFRAWVTVYRQARSMGLKQALDNLEELAGQLRLPGGAGCLGGVDAPDGRRPRIVDRQPVG